MKLTIGISPCPNDTFIFEAIYMQKFTLLDIEFEFIFEDVQTLNEMAALNKLDIVKISYAHYFNVLKHYVMLRSGGALGKGVGPLLVSKKPWKLDNLESKPVAIPGINTTANFLLTFACSKLKNKIAYKFDKIEDAILSGEVEAGVIIHENRFTYQEKGLLEIMDLGMHWEQRSGMPIPLGGIAIKRTLPYKLQWDINKLIKTSVEDAFLNSNRLTDFIKMHAQEMSETVIKQHIELYVNDYSLDVGAAGEKAVLTMKNALGISSNEKIFI